MYTLDISISLGAGQVGLSLKAQLVDTTGTNVGSAVTAGFSEIGLGNYLWHYAQFPDGHRGGVKFSKFDNTLMAFTSINPEEAEFVDVKVSSRGSQISIDTIDDFLDTEIAAIKAKTDGLPASPAAVGDIPTVVQIRSEMDSNSTKLASLDATISSRSTLTAAQVNTLLSSAHGTGSWESGSEDTLTVEDIVDGVWDESLADHNVTGSGAKILKNLSDVTLHIVSPITTQSYLEIVRGDDYVDENGRAILMTIEPCHWETGATITFTSKYNTTTLTKACEFVEETDTGIVAKLELTHSETSVLPTGNRVYRFDVQIATSGGFIETPIVQGKMTVLEDSTI